MEKIDITLVTDIGNTNIVIGVYRENILLQSWRLKTDTTRTEDEYFSTLKTLTSGCDFSLKEVKICGLSSVVPELSKTFLHLFDKYFKCKFINVNAYTKLGLTFATEDPGFIGADLIVNAYAAWKKYNTNCIICDFGTATTIQLVDHQGFFHGTAIIPGIMTSASSLFNKASLLSQISFESTDLLIGTNTRDALLAGIISGNNLMVDAFIRKLKQRYGYLGDIKAIATGGIAKLICSNSEEIEVIDQNLTLDGLKIICDLFR